MSDFLLKSEAFLRTLKSVYQIVESLFISDCKILKKLQISLKDKDLLEYIRITRISCNAYQDNVDNIKKTIMRTRKIY